MTTLRQNVLTRLHRESDETYKQFSLPLIPGVKMLGVRVPVLRKMAKEMLRNGEALHYLDIPTEYQEEKLLKAIITGEIRMPWDEKKIQIERFVPEIDNWAVCDIFCGGLDKTVKKDKVAVWEFLQPYLTSKEEYRVRFGMVMLFHFIDEEYIERLYSVIDSFTHEAYYARMAVAWLLSTCYVKFPKNTYVYLLNSRLDTWTFNKSLQKITESLRVTAGDKAQIRSLRRKS